MSGEDTEQIGQALDDAPPAPAPEDSGGGAADAGADGKGPRRRPTALPKDSPVTPLGKDGMICYYVNGLNQLIGLETRAHNQYNMAGLFAPHADWILDNFPQRDGDGNPKSKPDWSQVAMTCINDAARQGVWNPFERVRGRGGHVGDDGELIFHVGDRLIVSAPPPEDLDKAPNRKTRWTRPGKVGGFVYPAARPLPRPFDGIPRKPRAAGERVLALLRHWHWHRKIDARLLLGWIGAAILGGAPNWRPMVWVTGGPGTGKSTLVMDLLEPILGDWLLHASNTTAAGIWQVLQYDTRAVALDELEAEEANDKQQAVIALARQAASGNMLLRGGAGHEGTQFTARSCFMFSSVLIPPLLPADRSRMAILELDPIPADATVPPLDPLELQRLGEDLRAQLMAEWWRYDETFQVYRAAMLRHNHSARGADQFGALLAAADLLTEVGISSIEDAADGYADELDAESLAELQGQAQDQARCLTQLLTYRVEIRKEHRPLGDWIAQTARKMWANNKPDYKAWNKGLMGYGVRIHHGNDKGAGMKGVTYLAVATDHVGLANIFGGTHWGTRSGAQGVWVQSLMRLGVGVELTKHPLYFAGGNIRAVLIPLEHLKIDAGEADEFESASYQMSAWEDDR